MAGRHLADRGRPTGRRVASTGVRMTRLRAIGLVTAALGAAVVVWVGLTLPARPIALVLPAWANPRGAVRGVFHVHSRRSDGTGSIEDIAGAAARAGLDFVVLTDHGDGTRAPDPPAYHTGVLCVDAVEISTGTGHYAAVGMRPSPYPLGGEARDVVEDVRRLGGFGVATHPGSRKRELQWGAWEAPFDAIEWLNQDSEWRDESWLGMTRLLLSYPLRGPAAIAASFRRPDDVLSQWDAVTRSRPVVALAGADAHARFAIESRRDPYRGFSLPGFPSYESSFRVFALRVELERPFSGTAAEDMQLLLGALRAGHAYTALDALAGPADFEFTATSGTMKARGGDTLVPDGPVSLRARVNAPSDAMLVLLENGRPVARATGTELTHTAAQGPGVFRVEVGLPGAPGWPPVPWLVSNPIYLRGKVADELAAGPQRAAATSIALLDLGRLSDWRIEREKRSEGRLARAEPPNDRECEMTFRLGPGAPAGQFVALVRSLEPSSVAAFDRIGFRARSAAPMRLSIQLRAPGSRDGQRWQRSVYLDETPRNLTVSFDDMRPIGPTDSRRPDLRRADGLLFVVDTINARGGTAGKVWLRDVALEK